MPPRDSPTGLPASVFLLSALACVCCASPLTAQVLPLQREYPGSGPFECPAPGGQPERTPQELAQAGQLTSEADNAVILGDYGRAEQLLAQASQLDPSSAEVAYSHARVLETLERSEDAMVEYCRATELGAEAVGIMDSRDRLRALDDALRASISPAARRLFAAGLSNADLRLYGEAVVSFSDALEEVPDWPEAFYNRAILLEEMGLIEESLADYREYLSLRPDAVDPLVAGVSERIGMLEGLDAIPTASPGNTLAFGMLFPGMGQYYSGRTSSGAIVLGTVAAAVTAGIVYKKVTIRCLQSVQTGEDCPPGQIVDESSKRPLLAPALLTGLAVSVGGAVEAWFRARARRAEQQAELAAEASGLAFAGPSLGANGDRVDIRFVSLRFR